MNAFELANELDKKTGGAGNIYAQAATMLRQQQMKELTDEEILALWVQKNKLNGARDILDFARAILRKAQEK